MSSYKDHLLPTKGHGKADLESQDLDRSALPSSTFVLREHEPVAFIIIGRPIEATQLSAGNSATFLSDQANRGEVRGFFAQPGPFSREFQVVFPVNLPDCLGDKFVLRRRSSSFVPRNGRSVMQ